MTLSHSFCALPRVLVALALVLCSPAGGAATPAHGTAAAARVGHAVRHGGPRLDASGCGKAVVYVSSYDWYVYIYDQHRNGKTPCGQIGAFTEPQGLFVDGKRNLWIADNGNCGRTGVSSVFEFSPGGTLPIKTLYDGSGPASDVAVDNAGTVYVTNFGKYTMGSRCETSGNPDGVEVYARGSTYPTGTLGDPNMAYAVNDAVDAQGNVYVTYISASGSGQIDEWLGGGGSPINLGITLVAPGGIQTTSNGALLVCDQGAPACGNFAPGSTTMTNLFATAQQGPFGVALDKHEKHAWVENPSRFSGGQLQRWKYPGPSSGAGSITVPDEGSAGVAVSPPDPLGLPY